MQFRAVLGAVDDGTAPAALDPQIQSRNRRPALTQKLPSMVNPSDTTIRLAVQPLSHHVQDVPGA